MREGRPSLTAVLVSAARSVGPARQDELAPSLLPPLVGRVLGGLARHRATRALVRAASLGMVDHLALRTAAIDRVVRHGVEDGATQVVILGAGLDTRAWRLGLRDVRVFEVDHPDTQQRKRRLAPSDGAPDYVSVDFGKERVGDALDAAPSFDPSARTVWVWEGVTMYLPPVAVAETLAQVADRSAVGSTLAMTYLSTAGVPVPKLVDAAFDGLFGEALESRYTPADVQRLLAAHQFEVTEDHNSNGWDRDWGGNPRLAGILRAERLVVGVRT